MSGLTKIFCVVTAATLIAASCSKDKDSGTLKLDSSVLFFESGGQTEKLGFSAYNISKVTATSVPEGWSKEDVKIDLGAGTITITAPAEIKDDVEATGMMIFTGTTPQGTLASASLFVGVVATENLSVSGRANSYIATKPDTHYTIDVMHQGNSSEPLATASVGLIWQSLSGMVQYVELSNGQASFYIAANDDDKVKEGNALIGAYDAAGKLIWSWHIWVSDYDPSEDLLVYSNGVMVMNRNIGALKTANTTDAEVLASYGLYYQWGRKEPFIGPSTFDISNGSSATMYSANGARVMLTVKESSAETGTMDYATANPLHFITGVEASGYDWLYSAHSTTLWSDTKSVNDPCPSGWRIASKDAFAGLTIANDLTAGWADYYKKYGWTLSKDGVSSLYMAAGRRIYSNGSIQNIYFDDAAPRSEAMVGQPWVGFYWTSGAFADDNTSSSLYFWFNKSNVATSGIDAAYRLRRSNGASVRCVRESN